MNISQKWYDTIAVSSAAYGTAGEQAGPCSFSCRMCANLLQFHRDLIAARRYNVCTRQPYSAFDNASHDTAHTSREIVAGQTYTMAHT